MRDDLHQLYPARATSPEAARRDLRAYLVRIGEHELVPVATLALSEVVTNAIRHGRGDVDVRAEWDGEALQVLVADGGDGDPHIREPDHTGGYGLRIVADVTQDWGVVRNGDSDDGKITWFVVTHAALAGHSHA